MWFQAIFGLKALLTFKRVRIIDHNEPNNFLLGKEGKKSKRKKKQSASSNSFFRDSQSKV